MGTTAQKLQAVVQSKSAIKTAVANTYGIDLGDKLADWATNITKMPTVKITGNVADYKYMYSYGIKLANQPITKSIWADTIDTVDLSELGTVGQRGMYWTFRGCSELKHIIFPTNGLNPIGTGAFNYTFAECPSLSGNVTLPVARLDIGTVYDSMLANTNISELTLDVKQETITGLDVQSAIQKLINNTPLQKFTMRGLKSIQFASGTKSRNLFGNGNSNLFYGCNQLEEIVIQNLQNVSNTNTSATAPSFGIVSWFNTASSKTLTIRLPDLETLNVHTSSSASTTGGFFVNDTYSAFITDIYLPKCTFVGRWAFNYVHNGTFHFGAANQAAIEACAGYSNHFSNNGGNTTTFVFDL